MGRNAVAALWRAWLVGRVVLLVGALAVLGWVGYAAVQLYRLDTGISRADVIDPVPGGSGPAAAGSVSTPAGGPAPGEDNILLVGLDSRTDAHGVPLPAALLAGLHAGAATDGGGTTDTMIVVHVPASGGPITAISVPRDSYVRIADGSGQHKINSAFARGRRTATATLGGQGVTGADLAVRADEAGARVAIRTVAQLTGLTITHYAAVTLAGFVTVSDAVGGVPVCLRAAVHDDYSGARLPAGPQLVSGAGALAFVRQRHGLDDGDLGRIHRQQAFLAGLAHAVLSAGTLTDPVRLDRLVGALSGALVIDRTWSLVGFARRVGGLADADPRFLTIPVLNLGLRTPADGSAVQVDPDAVRAFVRAAIAEPAPATPVGPTTPAGPTTRTSPTSPTSPSTTTSTTTAPRPRPVDTACVD